MNKKHLALMLLVFIIVNFPLRMFSQTSTMGRHFIVALGSIQTGNPTREIKIAASKSTVVTLKFNNIGTTYTATIPAGSIYSRPITSNQEINAITATTTTGNRSLEVTADNEVSVYIMNSSSNNGDATIVLPVTALGTDYYHLSRVPSTNGNNSDAYVIVATENGTVVERNGANAITLNAGESRLYTFPVGVDGSGTHVTANKPIAYFVANQYVLLGNNSMVYEQLTPVNRWGTFYLVPTILANDRVKIVASQNGTNVIYWNGSPSPTTISLAAGGSIELTAAADSTSFWIQANAPIGVSSFLYSRPAMAQFPSVQQAVNEIMIAPFASAYLQAHYAIVVTSTLDRDDTRMIEGANPEKPLLGTWFTGAGNGNFSYQVVPLTNTSVSYIFSNHSGVLVWVYSRGNFNNSYYYVGGSGTREITNEFYFGDIGDINGAVVCLEAMIKIGADLSIPLSNQPGHLKWYQNDVELLQIRDSIEWYLPFLPNGVHNIKLEIIDAFDSLHIIETTFTQDCPETKAVPDTVAVLACGATTIDVLANDTLEVCPATSIEASVTTPSAAGGFADFNSDNLLIYTPPPYFAGWDSLEYTLSCVDTTSSAKVYILVMDCPDNISDASCFGDPPQTAWDIQELDRSDAFVHAYAQPLVGDFDGCGKNEVIAHNYVTAQTSDKLLIFDDQLKLKYTISIPTTYNYLVYPISIADVDRDGRAEIYVLTGNTVTRTLQCFSFNGTAWIAKPGFATSTITLPTTSSVGNIVIGDINGDGIPELFVYDRIINSITGALIATLPAGSRGMYNAYQNGNNVQFAVLADVDNDGMLDLVCGNTVYKAQINNGSTSGTATLAYQAPVNADVKDGFTSVADIDLDGYLDVVVTHNDNHVSKAYVWSPYKGILLGQTMIGNIGSSGAVSSGNVSRVFIGDVNNDGYPEIAFSYYSGMVCYRFDPDAGIFVQLWRRLTTDTSGMTTMSMFDFNQDGKQEIIYRDETHLRIMSGETGLNVDSIDCYSGTASEMPIVVDLSGDGNAQILVSGALTNILPNENCLIRRYVSLTPGAWAPARKVWNQHGYHAVNINEDLTVPRFQLNPATVFPNGKRPYNGFLMQQTYLNIQGDPLWPLPNVVPDSAQCHFTLSGNEATLTLGIVNKGNALIGPPVYIALYKDNIATTDTIMTVVAPMVIYPGDTVVLTIPIPDISTLLSVSDIIVRINDNGITYPFYEECASDNNEIEFPLMKKNAFLNSAMNSENGKYGNPVSVLYTDVIRYELTAVNVRNVPITVNIVDTLPLYMNYEASISDGGAVVPTFSNPPREVLRWNSIAVAAGSSYTVSFEATPAPGVCISQPMFINKAWVQFDSHAYTTNETFHQGAGAGYVTFLASLGGSIYNADMQPVDYRATPKSGIVILPDKGYRFAGWKHDGYTSLRGEKIPAQSGITYYDTLTVYGDVELRAVFKPEDYPIKYFLNGGRFSDSTAPPTFYTIESPDVVIPTPEKEDDVFVCWTDADGGNPQEIAIIPTGSTGERSYYANYLHYGREKEIKQLPPEENRIWTVNHELFIKTTKPSCIVRIYSMTGVLQKQQIILQAGETKIQLPGKIYIITLNNGIGQEIIINSH